MKEYIPTPYLAILFYLAYSEAPSYWIRAIYCDDLTAFIRYSDFKEVIDTNLLYFEIPEDDNREIGKKGQYYSVKVKNKTDLKILLNKYIKLFEADKLDSTTNYPVFEKQMILMEKEWQKFFENTGKKATIEFQFSEAEYKETDFRKIEALFSLIQRKHIKLLPIIDQTDIYNQTKGKPAIISFSISFLSPPSEIAGECKSWIEYNGLRANEKTGKVIHNKKEYSLPADKLYFRMLCYLLKNPNKKIPIKKILGDKTCADPQGMVKSYRKSIFENLKIAENSRKIRIKISSKHIVLE